MSKLTAKSLIRVLDDYGYDLIYDRAKYKKLKALLCDLFLEESRPVVRLLVLAVHNGVGEKIKRDVVDQNLSATELQNRKSWHVDNLTRNYAIATDKAQTLVELYFAVLSDYNQRRDAATTPPLRRQLELEPQIELTFKPKPGAFEDSVVVEILCDRDDGDVYFTDDGSEPTNTSRKYVGPLKLSQTTLIKARGYAKDDSAGDVLVGNFEITSRPQLPEVKVCPSPKGVKFGGVTIELTCSCPNATIVFTDNGAEPTQSSKPYEKPLRYEKDVTIKAKAFCDGFKPSETVEARYQIKAPTPRTVSEPPRATSKQTRQTTDIGIFGKRKPTEVDDGGSKKRDVPATPSVDPPTEKSQTSKGYFDRYKKKEKNADKNRPSAPPQIDIGIFGRPIDKNDKPK